MKPPKVNKIKVEEFELDIPDLGRADASKKLFREIQKELLGFRRIILVKGQMAKDIMSLHGQLNSSREDIKAMFLWNAHARSLKENKTPKCKFKKLHDNVIFVAVLLVYYFHKFMDGDIEEKKVVTQLAKLRALGAHGIDNYEVKGSDRDGYYLSLKKGCGLS